MVRGALNPGTIEPSRPGTLEPQPWNLGTLELAVAKLGEYVCVDVCGCVCKCNVCVRSCMYVSMSACLSVCLSVCLSACMTNDRRTMFRIEAHKDSGSASHAAHNHWSEQWNSGFWLGLVRSKECMLWLPYLFEQQSFVSSTQSCFFWLFLPPTTTATSSFGVLFSTHSFLRATDALRLAV